MRIIKRSHQHIKPETLSEYLDGRIQGSALAQVDQQLAACHLCREEMESLRSTITMLRELPQEAPRRSFVMAAPPPMLVRAPSSAFQLRDFLRVPQWAYAGAASVAVIVLVALISADVAGLLSPDGVPELQGQATAITQEIESRAAAPVAPEAAQASPEDTAPQVAAAPVAPAGVAAPEQSLAAAPTKEPSPEQAAEALGPRGARGAVSGGTPAELATPPIALPEVDKIPATAPVPTGVPQPQSEGTAVVWRVLEGVAAFFGLTFLVALGFKWRLSDKSRSG